MCCKVRGHLGPRIRLLARWLSRRMIRGPYSPILRLIGPRCRGHSRVLVRRKGIIKILMTLRFLRIWIMGRLRRLFSRNYLQLILVSQIWRVITCLRLFKIKEQCLKPQNTPRCKIQRDLHQNNKLKRHFPKRVLIKTQE